jgi:hypothetical protein
LTKLISYCFDQGGERRRILDVDGDRFLLDLEAGGCIDL